MKHTHIRAAAALGALLCAGAASAASPYYGVTQNSGTGRAAGHISGTWCVAASSSTAGVCAVRLDGPAGSVTATGAVSAATLSVATAAVSGYISGRVAGYRDIASGDATPSAAGTGTLRYNGSAALTVTNFDDGADGQNLCVINMSSYNLTITRDNLYVSGSSNIVLNYGDTFCAVKMGLYWYQTAGPNSNQ